MQMGVEQIIKALAEQTFDLATSREKQKKLSAQEERLKLIRELTSVGIDPILFDFLISNELDRSLKKQFGVAFLVATVFFTLLSYAIVVLNGVLSWGISNIAITALIVETPIQFIGLLYIIARNLFPQSAHIVQARPGVSKKPVRKPKAEGQSSEK